jgi:hypothetical protein
MELKVELHKRLLENLNLAALEHATEANLRPKSPTSPAEALTEMSVVLNKDDRSQLNQELYDEVMGLGPLEPLLKDESISISSSTVPQRIFIERGGKLQLTDITFKDERTFCGSSTRSSLPWAAGSTNPTPIATPALPMGHASTAWCRRWRWMAVWSRSGSSRRKS